MGGLILGAVGCGSKVAGTYTLSQTSNGGLTQCNSVNLSMSENSNTVSGTGTSGTCTETLTGTDLGNGTIQVTSLTLTLVNSGYGGYGSNQSCIYTGTITVNNNVVTGTLTSSTVSTYSNYGAYCSPTITISGSKTS